MRRLDAFVSYVFAHSRVQFHPAAFALLLSTFLVVLISVTIFVLSLALEAFGSTGGSFGFAANAAVYGPALFGELVRGHVKLWLGYQPEQWCFPATGIAGLTVGGIIGAAAALQWGRPLWLEMPIWGGCMAAAYLLMGWVILFDQKKRASKNTSRVTG